MFATIARETSCMRAAFSFVSKDFRLICSTSLRRDRPFAERENPMSAKPRSIYFAALALIFFGANPAIRAQAAAGPIRLEVDASHAPQKILHSHLRMPVQAGALTLYYPEWIPGEHMP